MLWTYLKKKKKQKQHNQSPFCQIETIIRTVKLRLRQWLSGHSTVILKGAVPYTTMSFHDVRTDEAKETITDYIDVIALLKKDIILYPNNDQYIIEGIKKSINHKKTNDI